MSEMERKQVKMREVTYWGDTIKEDNTMQLFLESEYSIYFEEPVFMEDLLQTLKDYYYEEDFECPYYIYQGTLYKVFAEQELNEYGCVLIETLYDGTLLVDAHFYNGGGNFREVVEDRMRKVVDNETP